MDGPVARLLDSMLTHPRLSPYALIFITVVIDLIGFGIVIPILPLYAEHFGATADDAGYLIAVFSLMQFLFTPVLGSLSDRIGRKPVLALSVLGSAGAFLMMGSAHALWMLFAGRVIDGITGGNISTAQAYISDITPPEQRAKGLGVIGAGFGVGFVVGPMLGGIAAQFGPRVPFFVAAALALMNSVAIWTLLPETRDIRRSQHMAHMTRGMVRQVLWQKGVALPIALYVVAVLAMSMIYATFALFLKDRFDLTERGTGFAFAGLGVIGVVCQLKLIGPAVRRFGEVRLSQITLISAAVTLAMVGLLKDGWAIAGALVLYGIANSFINTVILAIVSRRSPDDMQGRSIGVTQGAAALSRAVGPAVAGKMFHHLGAGAPFLGAAAVALAAGVTAVLFLPREGPPSTSLAQATEVRPE
jgi:MFS transporter, DHA1 family, tetracycline resistance protein